MIIITEPGTEPDNEFFIAVLKDLPPWGRTPPTKGVWAPGSEVRYFFKWCIMYRCMQCIPLTNLRLFLSGFYWFYCFYIFIDFLWPHATLLLILCVLILFILHPALKRAPRCNATKGAWNTAWAHLVPT